MTSDNYVMSGPDEAGWYWYRPEDADQALMVYVTYEGRPMTFDSEGDMVELDNTIGLWEIAEPNEI